MMDDDYRIPFFLWPNSFGVSFMSIRFFRATACLVMFVAVLPAQLPPPFMYHQHHGSPGPSRTEILMARSTNFSVQRRRQAMAGEARLATPANAILPLSKPTAEGWRSREGEQARPFALEGLKIFAVQQDPTAVICLDRTTGRVLWRTPLAEDLSLFPFLVGDQVVYAINDFTLVFLDAVTGKERRRVVVDNFPKFLITRNPGRLQFPALAGNMLLTGTHGKGASGEVEGHAAAHDLTNGQKLWEVHMAGGCTLSPTVAGDRVIVGGGSKVMALSIADGKTLWTHTLEKKTDMDLDPVVLGERLLLHTLDRVFALDLKDGKELWSFATEGAYLVLGEGERVLCFETRGKVFLKDWLVALDARNGAKVWEQKRTITALPWLKEGLLVCGVKEDIDCLDPLTGKEVWAYPLKAFLPINSALLVQDGVCYLAAVGIGESEIHAIEFKTGKQVWKHKVKMESSSDLFCDGKGLVFRSAGGVLIGLRHGP